jgi:hypothetical protein
MDAIAKAAAEERSLLFRRAETLLPGGIQPAIVEKDFWVCWTLRRVFEVIQFRPHLIFKGGTSLSKVYRAIDRFSEDVDLSLSRRDLGFADDHDPEQPGISRKEAKRRLDALVETCKATVRDKLVPEMRRDLASVLGSRGWSVELDADDPQTVLFAYPATEVSGATPYVRPVIRLEMGARSDDWPAVDAEITPYAAEVLPDVFSIRTCRVRTLAAERTFWEKATLLHAEYHRPADKPSRGAPVPALLRPLSAGPRSDRGAGAGDARFAGAGHRAQDVLLCRVVGTLRDRAARDLPAIARSGPSRWLEKRLRGDEADAVRHGAGMGTARGRARRPGKAHQPDGVKK